ncbi:MAG TPA: hypothetical protein VGD34_10715 [Kribbella sp.]|jgi:hypothetical protein
MELWVEQYVEGLAGLRFHDVDVLDLVDVARSEATDRLHDEPDVSLPDYPPRT